MGLLGLQWEGGGMSHTPQMEIIWWDPIHSQWNNIYISYQVLKTTPVKDDLSLILKVTGNFLLNCSLSHASSVHIYLNVSGNWLIEFFY